MTKSEAFDMLARVIESTDDVMINTASALTRIRGTYYGIMARGIDPAPIHSKINSKRAAKAKWRLSK